MYVYTYVSLRRIQAIGPNQMPFLYIHTYVRTVSKIRIFCNILILYYGGLVPVNWPVIIILITAG
jgi:hypothetical protein